MSCITPPSLPQSFTFTLALNDHRPHDIRIRPWRRPTWTDLCLPPQRGRAKHPSERGGEKQLLRIPPRKLFCAIGIEQFLRGRTSRAELRAVFVRPLCPQSYQERGGVLPNCSKSGKEKEGRKEGTKRYFFWMRGERESSKAGMGNTWANAAAVVAAFF